MRRAIGTLAAAFSLYGCGSQETRNNNDFLQEVEHRCYAPERELDRLFFNRVDSRRGIMPGLPRQDEITGPSYDRIARYCMSMAAAESILGSSTPEFLEKCFDTAAEAYKRAGMPEEAADVSKCRREILSMRRKEPVKEGSGN